MTRDRFLPEPTRNTLLVLLRSRKGAVAHAEIGSAILDADWDGGLSMLSSGAVVPMLGEFFCDTPFQADRAMAELAEIGDVPLRRRDFEPKWFPVRQGAEAVGWLLANRKGAKARRLLTARVCGELERLLHLLERARRSGFRFHLAILEPGEDRSFAGPPWKGGAGEQADEPDEAQ